MYHRDYATALTAPQQRTQQWLGDAESDATAFVDSVAGNDPYLNAIRAISVPMGQLRQRINAELNNVSNADAVVDYNQLGADLHQMDTYTAALQGAIDAFKASPAYRGDAQTAAMLNNWLAFIADWGSSTLQAIAQLPTDAANYLGTQAGNMGKAAIGGAIPWVLGGVALIYALKFAETSRTYRKVVA